MAALREIGAVIQIFLSLFCLFFGSIGTYVIWDESSNGVPYLSLYPVASALGIFGLVAFALGLAGAIFAFYKIRFSLAILGAVTMTGWSFLFITHSMNSPITNAYDNMLWLSLAWVAAIFSMVSLILVASSKSDFELKAANGAEEAEAKL